MLQANSICSHKKCHCQGVIASFVERSVRTRLRKTVRLLLEKSPRRLWRARHWIVWSSLR